MKTKYFIYTFLLISFCSLDLAHSEQRNTPVTIPTKKENILKGIELPPGELKIRNAAWQDLGEGTGLLTLNDPSLPMVTLELVFRLGTNAEAVEKAGTLEALTSLLQLGGTSSIPADKFAEELASIGAVLVTNAEYENWSVSITFLKQDYEKAMSLFTDLILHPAFPEHRLNVVKNGMLTNLEQAKDNPSKAGGRRLAEIMYPGKRRGYQLKAADIERITVAEIQADYQKRTTRDQLLFAVSGDIAGLPLGQALHPILSAFPGKGQIQAEAISFAELTKAKVDAKGKILLLEFPQAVQASILIAGYLPRHADPRFFALQLGNFILGGGSFNSRLMREIRVKRGLAYYAFSFNDFNADDGRFMASSGTRLDQVDETLQIMRQLIAELRQGTSESERELARDSILNALIFQFDEPHKILKNKIRYMQHHLPDDYISGLPEHFSLVTEKDIIEAAGLYDQAGMFTMVVGPASLKKSLEKIAPVIMLQMD